ncbi:shikimate kinase, chloroplastic isoform X2 [Malania oleifera]|nr:shikimate kinase, chloroplastic isoform X2 [Malania oleifera]XP_057969921.1 shikimate kinase, chloroplastic isoform X2 [Malania oleifera]
MEAKITQSMYFSTWIEPDKISWKPSISVQLSQRCREQQGLQMLTMTHLQHKKTSTWHRPVSLEAFCSFQKFPGSNLEFGSVKASVDNASILKNKSQEIVPYLNGRCIYLVGMMGCGKTTVGKILSELLGYSFVDSDALVEQSVGEISVAEIFKLYGEGFFREKESEILWDLSLRQQLVVSTGGGAVVWPINWEYMRKGISVWLDVPLKALAQRIAAVGTNSRPLLHDESGDAFEKTYWRLYTLLAERSEAYSNANARVSLEYMAAKLGYRDVSNIAPATIAMEVLEEIEGFLRDEEGIAI